MGFCRRCGDIVSGPRCKCGGTAVAPVVSWNHGASQESSPTDRWSRTYVTREEKPSARASPRSTTTTTTTTTSTKRFPQPTNSTLGSRVTAHITSTTTSQRSSGHSKRGSSFKDDPSAHPDILPSPYNNSELAKVYGSVLQKKETLATFHCHVCQASFPPDATIYPDPVDDTGKLFMCRACFIVGGGSAGDCQACKRPVLILKTDGGFVENAGRVWHKKCFVCSGCEKSIGDHPLVDLLGHPSCMDCFDTCLQRKGSPKRPSKPLQETKDDRFKRDGRKSNERESREGISAFEELEQRLDRTRSRETTPVRDLPRRPVIEIASSMAKDMTSSSPLFSRSVGRESSPLQDRSYGDSPSSVTRRVEATMDGSPVRRPYDRFRTPEPEGGDYRERRISTSSNRSSNSPKPSSDAVEEMKRRFLRSSGSPAPEKDLSSSPSSTDITPRTTPRARALSSAPSYASPLTERDKDSLFNKSTSRHSLNRDSDPPLRNRLSSSSLRRDIELKSSRALPIIPSPPDLISDLSDTTTQSSEPSSPHSYSPSSRLDDDVFSASNRLSTASNISDMKISSHVTGETIRSTYSMSVAPSSTRHAKKTESTPTQSQSHSNSSSSGPSPDAKCAKCSLPLFTVKSGGRYVTVPEPSAVGAPPKVYHSACFRCRICDRVFEEKEGGQAVFVRGIKGACHLDCAPPEKKTIRTTTAGPFIPPTRAESVPTPPATKAAVARSTTSPYISSRYTPPATTAPATAISFPRFGSSTTCGGCHQAVSVMERGVVPGPQGSRWHATCLVCGGKEAKGRGGRRKDGKAGCGKQLDSSAKRDAGEGGVWCRECLLLLPLELRSPSPLKPTNTGGKITAQHTGGTTIARQYTGGTTISRQYTGGTTIARQFTGGADGPISRQLTGGGLAPTRQLSSSPTKAIGRQHTGGSSYGGSGASLGRPRPKSVIGMRDEGSRGMYLIRQMTGGGGGY